MSQPDNKPLDPEMRKRVVNDALRSSGFIDRHGPKPLNELENAASEADAVRVKIQNLIFSIIAADHDRGGKYNRDAAHETILKFAQDEFNRWSKDDLNRALSVVLATLLIEKCDSYAEGLL